MPQVNYECEFILRTVLLCFLISWTCFKCATTSFELVKINKFRATELWGYVRLDVASNATSGWKGKEGTGYCIESQQHCACPGATTTRGPLFASVSAVNIKCTDYIEKVDFWWKETVGIRVALEVQSICTAGVCTRPGAEQMKTNTTLVIHEIMLIYRI